MKSKLMKVYVTLFAVVMLMIIGKSTSYAASATITASSKDVSLGTSVTIKVSGSGRAWSLKVSGSGISDTIVGGNLSSKENQSFSQSYTLNTSKAGTYKVSLTGDVTDSSGTKDINDSVTVKVSEKVTSQDGNKTTTKTDTTKTDTKKTEEPTFKAANDTMYATGDINVRKSYSADSEKIGSLKSGEKITRTGIGSNGWSKVKYNGGVGYIKTSLLTDTEPKKSDDKSLKSLKIEGFEIDPQFDPEITDYTIGIDKEIDKLEIKAEPNSDKAKVEITGNEKVSQSDGIIKITVTAEDGTTRIYTITASKSAGDKSVKLTSLKINGYNLTPAFSPNTKEYKLTINDANVNKLDVVATVADTEKTKIEITGNTELKNGSNEILIKLKADDGSEVGTYKIIVTKNAASPTATAKNNNKWMLYAGIGVIAFLILAIVIVIMRMKRNSYYDEEEEYEDESTEKDSDFENQNNNEQKVDSTNNLDDLYGSLKDESNKSKYVEKDVGYYSEKISDLFDADKSSDDKATGDIFGYLSQNETSSHELSNYESNDNEYSDNEYNDNDTKSHRRGKHSK